MGINIFFMICRLSRILVKNGLADLKVKIGNEIVMCVKSILMNGNSTMRKLLQDKEMNGILELYEKCEIKSFLEIEKYYSGGMMEIDNSNICDILKFCIYYNDVRIMGICKKYLKNHLTDSIMMELFNILHMVNINDDILNGFEKVSEEFIKLNGFKYLNEGINLYISIFKLDELLLKLNIESLKFILNNKQLIIIDETWLLNRLLKWYRKVLKKEKENEEELNEFISLLKSRIPLNEIKIEEISKKNLKELSELNLERLNEKVDYICIKVKDVENLDLIKLIHEYYPKEDSYMVLDDNMKNKLNTIKVKEEMIKLLNSEDVKLVEIILNVIIEMKINEIIPSELTNKLLRELLSEYGRGKRNRTLRCLCLFVDDKKNIITIENLCGKEILYRILNEEKYLNSKSKELLIKYIQAMKLNESEKEEMSKVINNKQLLNELKIKIITSFSYPQIEYLFGINEEISLIPSFDGEKCKFSVKPSLPNGLVINKENGIIHGKVENCFEKCEYRIKCKNIESKKQFRISLEFQIKFVKSGKSEGISISNDGRLVTATNNNWNHCYLNQRMEGGVYHIKYLFHQNNRGDDMMLGLSTDNSFSGINIHSRSTTCNYYALQGKSYDITYYCRIGTVVNKNPNFKNHGDGSIYEIIVDMNKREYWISHNNSPPVLLVKELPSPLYTYVALVYSNTSFELLSVYHQN